MKQNNPCQKIVVFGATSAIAVATMRILAGRGSAFFLVGRSSDRLQAVADDLKVRGAAQVATAQADLVDFKLHRDLLRQAAQALGGLDLALIAHGTLSDQARCENDFAEAERELKNNLISPISILTELANLFESQRHGKNVVISSVAGERGRKSNYLYGTAKGGLTIFLGGLRNRLASRGVSVITVKPGFVDTPMTASFRKGILFASTEKVGAGIVRAIDRNSDVVYLPWFWRPIMRVIREIPEAIFKRLSI